VASRNIGLQRELHLAEPPPLSPFPEQISNRLGRDRHAAILVRCASDFHYLQGNRPYDLDPSGYFRTGQPDRSEQQRKDRIVVTANELVERYLAIWNEQDSGKRAVLVEQTWVEAPIYVDPLINASTREEILAFVGGVQAQFPGFAFRPVGNPEIHNNRIRFSWEMVSTEDGSSPVAGTDFGYLSIDGRFVEVTGFLDRAPSAS
jgi:hypothetical protein